MKNDEYLKINIKQVQEIYKKRFVELQSFLKENNIKYFTVGGTTLGAIRHQGFIPWDDDIDIGMTREEYEKFLKCCRLLNKEHFACYCARLGSSPVDHGLLKISLLGTSQVLNIKKNYDKHMHIDVFPYDFVPDDEKVLNKIVSKQKVLKKILFLKSIKHSSSNSKFKTFILKLAQCALVIFPSRYVATKLDALGRACDLKIAKKVTNLMGAYTYYKEMVSFDCIKSTSTHIFEDFEVEIPCDYDGFLTSVYGDYMKPSDIRFDVNKFFAFCSKEIAEEFNFE